jgi:hypothetical protein
MVTPTKSG